MKILLIDDDQDYSKFFTRRATDRGHDVCTTSNSTTAVDAALSFSPDIIIIDLFMPNKNGFQLAREFRSLEAFKKTKIIIASAVDYQHATLYSNILADTYIEKTGEIEEVLLVCEKLMKGTYSQYKKEKI